MGELMDRQEQLANNAEKHIRQFAGVLSQHRIRFPPLSI